MRNFSPARRWFIGLSVLMAMIFAIAKTGAYSPAPLPLEPSALTSSWIWKVPRNIKQGEVVRVEIMSFPPEVAVEKLEQAKVNLAGETVPLFRQKNGGFLALVPISVYQKPGGYTLSIKTADGQTLQTSKVEVADGRYQRQNIRVSSSNAGLKAEPGELETVQKLKETVTPIRYWEEPFVSPTTDCQNSPFGVKRYHNGQSTGDYHKGLDLRSPAGRPIVATNSGVVQIARMYRLHGGTVGLDHGQGITSIYIHMSQINVKPGQLVKKGDVIGKVGSTGFATGPHLHWGFYVNGLPVEPRQWVSSIPRC